MLHAWRNATRRLRMDEGFTMLIGPDGTGRMLEIGVLDADGEDPVIVHAMPLRLKFLRNL